MRNKEFARTLASGTYDLIVLDVLRDGPAYGYGIVKRILEQSKHTIRWHEGTIYPVLHHLEEQGLVRSAWQPASASGNRLRRGTGSRGGRQRRYYRLTVRGQRVWQAQRQTWRAFSKSINALLGL